MLVLCNSKKHTKKQYGSLYDISPNVNIFYRLSQLKAKYAKYEHREKNVIPPYLSQSMDNSAMTKNWDLLDLTTTNYGICTYTRAGITSTYLNFNDFSDTGQSTRYLESL